MIITIDGPAGSGKSTVAGLVAKHLNFMHFNSGLLYRGITAHLISINFEIEQITVNSPVPELSLKVEFINNVQHVFVNNIDYTSQLRDNKVSTLTPFISSNQNIRDIIDKCQRAFAEKNNIVVDGRDTGSFVFPHAEFKFYLDCSVSERARRRFSEEQLKNNNITLQEIEQQLTERDLFDKTKKIAPLIVPKNAIMLDSTNLNISQVVEEVLQYIN